MKNGFNDAYAAKTKLLVIVGLALILMACGGNNAELPDKDMKALEATTVKALPQLGQSAATVEKSIINAGFVKTDLEDLYFNLLAPQKVAKFSIRKSSDMDDYKEVFYVRNIDAEDLTKDDAAITAKQNEILKKGKAIMIVYALYGNDKLLEMTTSTIISTKQKEAKKNYLSISEGLYKQIPANAFMVEWGGETEQKDFSKYDEFAAYIAAAEKECTAEEFCYAITKMTITGYEGFMYQGIYVYPDEEQIAYQAKAGSDPFITIVFGLADMAGMADK